MKQRAALTALSLKAMPATADEVRGAFARAVRSAHPDHGGSGQSITLLKKARDTLLAEIAKRDALIECPKCGGAGTIVAKRRVKCPKCGGTGKVRR